MNKFVSDLQSSLNEKDVENKYREEISKRFKVTIVSPFGCDGYFTIKDRGVLCEFKFSKRLKNVDDFLQIMSQVIFYLKKFSEHVSEYTFPSVVFIGDENECAILNTNPLNPYLTRDYNWSLPPCEAFKDKMLMKDLRQDTNLAIPVFDVSDNFSLICNIDPYLKRILTQEKADIIITQDTIVDAYNYWLDNVVKDKNITNEDNVDIFMRMLLNAEDVFLHPKKKDTLACLSSGKEVKIDNRGYFTFFSLYKEQHSIEQIRDLTAVKDRLLLEKHRRRTGAFFTPKKWVDEAHKMLDEQLGPNWREEYVVWDASAGTANLTRDYKFKELYLSTLEQTDVDIILKSGFNPGATVFQFDFLNDPIEKLPAGLRKALEEGRPIVFLNNPPYGTSSDYRQNKGTNIKTINPKTLISLQMKNDGFGKASIDLSGQFIYRLCCLIKNYGLTNANVFLFIKAHLLTGKMYSPLRISFLDKFMKYQKGFIFPSREFSNVQNRFPILYVHYSVSFDGYGKDYYEVQIRDLVRDNFVTAELCFKKMYNDDRSEITKRQFLNPGKKISLEQALLLKNPIKVSDNKDVFRKVAQSLGYLSLPGDMVYGNNQDIFILSSICNHGIWITEHNFNRIVSEYTSRVLITPTWMNGIDIYLIPNINHEQYQQYIIDSLIISMFSNTSYQSSLRQVTYHSTLWDLENHFFYLSNSEMRDLANQHNNPILYQDTFKYPNDRFVFNKLKELEGQFSPDAQAVLDKAIELTRLSFPYRKDADPKFHLNSWDAGWYQIRMGILKEHFKPEYEEFRQLLLNLRKRMSPLVYELGFLKK